MRGLVVSTAEALLADRTFSHGSDGILMQQAGSRVYLLAQGLVRRASFYRCFRNLGQAPGSDERPDHGPDPGDGRDGQHCVAQPGPVQGVGGEAGQPEAREDGRQQ